MNKQILELTPNTLPRVVLVYVKENILLDKLGTSCFVVL